MVTNVSSLHSKGMHVSHAAHAGFKLWPFVKALRSVDETQLEESHHRQDTLALWPSKIEIEHILGAQELSVELISASQAGPACREQAFVQVAHIILIVKQPM